MVKEQKIYKCKNCGNTTQSWYGKCPACKEFNTLQEEIISSVSNKTANNAGLKSAAAIKPAKKASTIKELKNKPIQRTKTGIGELDRVLGGGFVDGEVVVLAGSPGAGKSSLSLMIANCYAEMGKIVLYVSGEESEQQIGLRANRFGINNDNIKIANETNLETLIGHIEDEKPDFVIVDSLQTIASTEIPGSIGSISQSKEAAHVLTKLAKSNSITMLLINQVTKE